LIALVACGDAKVNLAERACRDAVMQAEAKRTPDFRGSHYFTSETNKVGDRRYIVTLEYKVVTFESPGATSDNLSDYREGRCEVADHKIVRVALKETIGDRLERTQRQRRTSDAPSSRSDDPYFRLLAELERTYPQIDPDSPQSDSNLISTMADKIAARRAAGMTGYDALRATADEYFVSGTHFSQGGQPQRLADFDSGGDPASPRAIAAWKRFSDNIDAKCGTSGAGWNCVHERMRLKKEFRELVATGKLQL
jgi:hypothetical protein